MSNNNIIEQCARAIYEIEPHIIRHAYPPELREIMTWEDCPDKHLFREKAKAVLTTLADNIDPNALSAVYDIFEIYEPSCSANLVQAYLNSIKETK